MYDFIDNTNPGRLDMKMKSMLFGNIERAYKIMLTKDLEVIKENLFTQVQFNCSLAKKRQRN